MKQPENIGRYKILQPLGTGGMSRVYLAHDPVMARDVAIKVLPLDLLNDPDLRTRFENEVRTIASLEHLAIVPVYDFGDSDGQPYLVMRYMSGGTLNDRWHKSPLTLDDVVRLLRQLAPALQLVHQRGIIHRDLKPANILFDASQAPCIADFGIAKLTRGTGDNTRTGLTTGTPAYMSPEQIRADRSVTLDARSDIYSLGVIVHTLLAGEVPFNAESDSGVMIKHLLEPRPRLRSLRPGLPAAIETVLDRAMAKQREDRYASVLEFVDDLDRAQRGKPIAIAKAAPAPKLGKDATPPKKAQIPAPTQVLPATTTVLQTPAKPRNWQRPAVAAATVAALLLGMIALFRGTPARPVELPVPTLAVAATATRPAPTVPSVATATLLPTAIVPTATSVPTALPAAINIPPTATNIPASPTEPAAATATGTSVPTASVAPTRTPAPTTVPRATTAPTTIPSPTLTSVPSLTAAPGTRYNAFGLLAPVDGFSFDQANVPAFRWSSAGALDANDYYRLQVNHRQGADVLCTKGTAAQGRGYLGTLGTTFWSVVIVRADGPVVDGQGCTGSVLAGSETRALNRDPGSGGGGGGGGGGVPTPTKAPR